MFFSYEMILTDGYYDVSTSKPVGWYYLALVFHGPSGGITVYHDGVQVGEEPNKITWSAPYVPGTTVVDPRAPGMRAHLLNSFIFIQFLAKLL